MKEVKKTRGLGGVLHGLDSFVSQITDKGLELAEGSKVLQRHMPETYKGIKSARQMYADYNKEIASGKARTVTGKAAVALAQVVDGLGKDTKSKVSTLLGKINPFKKKAPAVVMPTADRSR
ncbi:MAG: hypothetical protein KHX55_06300 [Proteobacteria bacterium]|nr:hypothetical protein [Pseudomonadota bacterium]